MELMLTMPLGTLLFGISGGEIMVLLLLVLLLFGPGKIPEIARMIGRGMSEVKKVQREINTEIHRYSSEVEREAREVENRLRKMSEESEKPVTKREDQTADRKRHPEGQPQPESKNPPPAGDNSRKPPDGRAGVPPGLREASADEDPGGGSGDPQTDAPGDAADSSGLPYPELRNNE